MPNSTSLIALLIGLALAAGVPATGVAETVTAEHGVAVGGDIRDSTITVGSSPEQVATLIRASNEALRTTYETQVKALSGQLDVTQNALLGFFQTLREQNVPVEKLPATLATIAERYRAMQERLAALDPDDPAVKALIAAARAALDVGEYDRADTLLSQAETAELAAARQAEQLAHDAQATADRRRLNAAAARAERGELSLTRLNFLEAAEHFRAASETAPASAPTERGTYLRRCADAFSDYGDQQGDNTALLQAIALYERVLEALSRARVPLAWATTQTNLGIALRTLGAREAGTARLEEAVAAYRAALEEITRAQVPLAWAATQHNLGVALATLGAREAGTARLEEAVAAYRAALEERTRAQAPLAWATTQTNLGVALATLGAREAGTARLEEAVAAYRAALEEITRARAPLDWAATQNSLGAALATLGAREAGTARLEEAVAAYRAALEEATRARVPLAWAATQHNLGVALATLGEREAGTARLEEAVAAYRAALEEITRARAPLDWAATQNSLGAALATLGAREAGTARLEEAVAAYRAALEERTRARVPLAWAATQHNLGVALATLGEREAGTARLEEAVAAYRAALEEATRARVPLAWAATQHNLAWAYWVLTDWANAAAVYQELLDADPTDGAAYAGAQSLYGDHLFQFDNAFTLGQQWLARNPNDLDAQVNFAEEHFTTGRFSEAHARLTALLNQPELTSRVKLVLHALDLAALLALAETQAIPAQLAALQERVAAWPENTALDWSFGGTRHFIRQQNRLASHPWLDALLAALQEGDHAAARAALEQAQAALGPTADPKRP